MLSVKGGNKKYSTCICDSRMLHDAAWYTTWIYLSSFPLFSIQTDQKYSPNFVKKLLTKIFQKKKNFFFCRSFPLKYHKFCTFHLILLKFNFHFLLHFLYKHWAHTNLHTKFNECSFHSHERLIFSFIPFFLSFFLKLTNWMCVLYADILFTTLFIWQIYILYTFVWINKWFLYRMNIKYTPKNTGSEYFYTNPRQFWRGKFLNLDSNVVD